MKRYIVTLAPTVYETHNYKRPTVINTSPDVAAVLDHALHDDGYALHHEWV